MDRIQLEPNTTMFPIPVVLITCGSKEQPNIMSLNRISSCNAEPPMLAISVRPGRYSHGLIEQFGEFVVNIPPPYLEPESDYVGVTTGRDENKWQARNLTPLRAEMVAPPLIAECPVNLECRVVQHLSLPSHTVFIGQVVAMHAVKTILNRRNEVDLALFSGLRYEASVVRERPVQSTRVEALRNKVVLGDE
jgi:flavin reductase (DIM6/NTAB) family NADH-FMN oxidoreductase RutF